VSNEKRNRDEMTYDELYVELLATTDWNVGDRDYSTDGVVLTLRKHYTSNAPGVETREVFGTDEADAFRRFFDELAEQAAG
jgi:hypothetical protein